MSWLHNCDLVGRNVFTWMVDMGSFINHSGATAPVPDSILLECRK